MATTSKAIEAVLSAACVADALGAATECMHPDEIVRVFGGPVTTFRTPPEKTPFAKGLAPGRLTDDATQMLAMAKRIIGLDRPPVSADAIAGVTTDPDQLLSDIHGSADYRANLITVMAKRAVAACG